MIQDILNLFKLKPEPIEYYQKYSIGLMLSVAVFISVAYGLLLPHPPEISLIAHFLLMLMIVPIVAIVTWFLVGLLKLKRKNITFQALFALSVLASMIDLVAIPLEFLSQFNGIFDYLSMAAFGYSLLVLLFSFVKATEVGAWFGVLSILLGAVVLTVLMVMISLVFIAIGLLPELVLPLA